MPFIKILFLHCRLGDNFNVFHVIAIAQASSGNVIGI